MRAVLLDALGTLLELEPPWPLLREELARRGVEVTEDDARGALLAEMAYYRAHHDEAVDLAALDDLRDRCTAVLAAGLPPRARELPDLKAALLASLRFRPYPEVPEVLAALRERGAALVVVSNWDVSLHGVLAATGLAPLVDHVLTSAEEGAAKPDRAIFARALARAGARPGEAVHAGDSVEADVEGARAAGVRAVLVARDGAPAPAGVEAVADLRGLLAPGLYRPGPA
ncbi:MAG: HAD-IA family hydrolase [Solirubrobacterales bacterium]|nr:HAD-IA family hydrolase [Solirubrobacterales bacterium]